MAQTMKIRQGDVVHVIRGKDRGKQGRVIESIPKDGRVMFELAGVPEPLAKEALRLAGQKLSVKTKVVKREEELF